MNMIKEGIQTRQRKQKTNTNSVKLKIHKPSNTNKETKAIHLSNDIALNTHLTQENYVFNDFYSSEFSRMNRPLTPNQMQTSTHSTKDSSKTINHQHFDAEQCARDMINSASVSSIGHIEQQQQLKIIRTNNMDSL
jgi:hypothetical protein